MDISSLVSSFATAGSYVVTRTPRGTTDRGKISRGPAASFTITASVSPAMGDDLKRLPEGRRSAESRCIYSTVLPQLGGQGLLYEADVVTIDGVNWEVEQVQTWNDPLSGLVCYKAIALSLTG